MSSTICCCTLEDAAALSELASACFVHAFGAVNTAADMSAYLEGSLSITAITAELEDPQNTFLWVQGYVLPPPSATGPSTSLPAKGRRPLGYAKYRRDSAEPCVDGARRPVVELERIYVVPDLIGNGVGKAMLDEVIRLTRAEGFCTLWLGVWEHNPKAIKFYVREGFVDVGTHDFVLGDDTQTDRIMVLDIKRSGSRSAAAVASGDAQSGDGMATTTAEVLLAAPPGRGEEDTRQGK